MNTTILVIDFATKVLLSGGLLSLLVVVWKAASRFARLEATVQQIADNHLPHIYERLGRIEEKLDGRN